jgi:hypothetical protein
VRFRYVHISQFSDFDDRSCPLLSCWSYRPRIGNVGRWSEPGERRYSLEKKDV